MNKDQQLNLRITEDFLDKIDKYLFKTRLYANRSDFILATIRKEVEKDNIVEEEWNEMAKEMLNEATNLYDAFQYRHNLNMTNNVLIIGNIIEAISVFFMHLRKSYNLYDNIKLELNDIESVKKIIDDKIITSKDFLNKIKVNNSNDKPTFNVLLDFDNINENIHLNGLLQPLLTAKVKKIDIYTILEHPIDIIPKTIMEMFDWLIFVDEPHKSQYECEIYFRTRPIGHFERKWLRTKKNQQFSTLDSKIRQFIIKKLFIFDQT